MVTLLSFLMLKFKLTPKFFDNLNKLAKPGKIICSSEAGCVTIDPKKDGIINDSCKEYIELGDTIKKQMENLQHIIAFIQVKLKWILIWQDG